MTARRIRANLVRQRPKVIYCVRGVISPLLSNIYLNEVDKMLERAKEATRYGKYTGSEYARFADDLVILIDAYPRHDWLLPAVEKRLPLSAPRIVHRYTAVSEALP